MHSKFSATTAVGGVVRLSFVNQKGSPKEKGPHHPHLLMEKGWLKEGKESLRAKEKVRLVMVQ